MNEIELRVGIGRTGALRDFRLRSGHTTQYMLTLVVGANAVAAGKGSAVGLPASWEPQSLEDAAARARTFALQAATVWTVESVFGYVASVAGADPAYLDPAIAEAVRTTRNKEEKLVVLCRGVQHAASDALALVRAAMVWRNRLTHINATNQLQPDVIAHLEASADAILEHYQGLRVGETLKRIKDGAPPRLKEAAAIARAAGDLTRSLDEAICRQVEVERYLDDVLRGHLRSAAKPGAAAAGIWGSSVEKNARSVLNVAAQSGMRIDVPDPIWSDLPLLTPKEAQARLLP